MSNNKNKIVRSFLVALFSFLSFTALATWSPPVEGPTEGNTKPPVNVGASLQLKSGPLAVTGLRSFSYGIFNGDVIMGANEMPTARLDVRGKAKMTAFQLPTGAGLNKLLVSDASGNASWVDVSSIPGAGGAGEANTASNLGGGLANFDSKDGVVLRFNTFKAEDFNLNTNLISLDYTNGQKANASQPGFLSSADWNTFNGKLSNITGLVTGGTNISITGNGTSATPYVINHSGGAITSLNGLTAPIQTFAVGNSGTNFNISSSGSTHTFNIPFASPNNVGLVTTEGQVFSGLKYFANGIAAGNGQTTVGFLQLQDMPTPPANVHYVRLTVPNVVPSSYVIKLPSTPGTVGQVLKIQSISGDTLNLIWANP